MSKTCFRDWDKIAQIFEAANGSIIVNDSDLGTIAVGTLIFSTFKWCSRHYW